MNTKTIVINGQKVNYDGCIDYSVLSDEVVVYDNSTAEEVIERSRGCGILISKEYPLPAEVIEKLDDSISLICEAGTGYNNIDLETAKKKGITVCNIPAYSTQRVAHTAIMLMLNLASSMRTQISMLAHEDHRNFTEHLTVPHTEINGKTMGIIGAGMIGREVIKLARSFGMDVVVYTRTPREDEEGIHYTSLEDVLKTSDYLSLHCPLNEKTHHLIGQKELELMKPSACIINTARGALIDEQALIKALRSGVIAGAGLDVQETEPPKADNPLYTMENVLLTPHMGWKGLETRQRLLQILRDNVQAYIKGEPINVVG